MWFKENLLNIALSKVPLGAKYITWSDADINFLVDKNGTFAEKIIKSLDVYPVA
jgi:hypothetical protein